ncbi:MAG: S8 family serine peptidase [Kovacikia sp.]
MKRFLSSVCLTGYLLATASLTDAQTSKPTSPRRIQLTQPASASSDLYYTFYGQRIPLVLRQDTIAVAFKPQPKTRGLFRPLYQQLQQDLQKDLLNSTSRSPKANPSQGIEVSPLGEDYALVKLPAGTRSLDSGVAQRVQQQPYVESTLPVLARKEGNQMRDETIILPNEILVSFDRGLSIGQIQSLLDRDNLTIVRPLRFTQNRYIVKSRTAAGIAILAVANRLHDLSGVQSATPNFIQSLPFGVQEQMQGDRTAAISETTDLNQRLVSLAPPPNSPFPKSLLPLQWHLDSRPERGRFPRTDLHAVEAWQHSSSGRGVVVAVIDSVIQWDHPDLVANVYTVGNVRNKLAGETHGWDFSGDNGGDPDTRLSDSELAELRPDFQNTFQLSDGDLLKQYDGLAKQVKAKRSDYTDRQVADVIRNYIRSTIAAEFHGTWVSGVIAAHPQGDRGAVGVAPNAKLLPVRVFGLGGKIASDSLIEAIGYAAERGADVVNMSLGGLLPDEDLTDQLFHVLDTHPNLLIVASAGNESLDGAAFPAAIPGVVSVGATNLNGNRAFYSSFGGRLDVVAPGGETTLKAKGGILTTGGTGAAGFWEGIAAPKQGWGMALDPQGNYVQVQGTSFSSPNVAGVLALMQGENQGHRLRRDRLVTLLKQTASYTNLAVSQADANRYRLQAAIGFGTAIDFPFIRPSGVFGQPHVVSAQQYYFGSGLVNADAAVRAVKQGR